MAGTPTAFPALADHNPSPGGPHHVPEILPRLTTRRQPSTPIEEAARDAASGQLSTTVELEIAAHIHLTLVTHGHTVTFLAAKVGVDERARLRVFDHCGGQDAVAHAEYVRAWADTHVWPTQLDLFG